jgi:agmatinase
VQRCDVAIVGIPFDAGTSYRPGARFGPQAVRQASRHLRTDYHPAYDSEPFREQQVADAGDIACNPFNIEEAVTQIEADAVELYTSCGSVISIGGDHTIALPLLRAVNARHGVVLPTIIPHIAFPFLRMVQAVSEPVTRIGLGSHDLSP